MTAILVMINRERILSSLARENHGYINPLFWLGITRFTIIISLMFGAALLVGERESGTAITMRMIFPHPGIVFLAKTVVAVVWGFISGFIAGIGVPFVIRTSLGQIAAEMTTAHFLFISYGFRVGIINALCALIGLALAAILRSFLASTVVGFLWVWFENIIASLFGDSLHIGVLTPWRNLSYFIDAIGYELPYLWGYRWGFMPLAILAAVLLSIGVFRHRADVIIIKN